MKNIIIGSLILLLSAIYIPTLRADWGTVASNISKIRDVDERTTDVLGLAGMTRGFLGEADREEILTLIDIHHVFYLAANVALANEYIEDFNEYIDEINGVLDDIMDVIQDAGNMPMAPPSPLDTTEETKGI